MLRFTARLVASFLRVQAASLLWAEHWNIGVVARPIHTFLDDQSHPTVRWLPNQGRERYFADPFAIRNGSKITMLVEEFDYETNRGHIASLDTDLSGSLTSHAVAIREDHHLSYPYLIEDEGMRYCVPESGAADRITLYEAVEFPLRWKRVCDLVTGFRAVDSTVFLFGGQWWLFCIEGARAACHLHAWHAPALKGPWRPHAANPLKTDACSSRPAGTPFLHQGQLYRPAQDCSKTYGGAVIFNRVTRLSPTEFAEEVCSTAYPDPNGEYPFGVHTVCALGDVTLIDGKQWVLSAAAFRNELRRKMRKLYTRRPRRRAAARVDLSPSP